MSSTRARLAAGFTLLEMLIALSLVALLGAGSYTLLSNTLLASKGLNTRLDASQALQRSLRVISTDIRHAIAQPAAAGQNAAEQPAFLLVDGQTIAFTRAGYVRASSKHADLVRVGYMLAAERLASDSKPTLQRSLELGQGTTRTQMLFQGIQSWSVAVQDESGAWHRNWPVPARQNKPPETLFEQAAYQLPVMIKLEFGMPDKEWVHYVNLR